MRRQTIRITLKSLPSRERGLKRPGDKVKYIPVESLPSRERGLKQTWNFTVSVLDSVAPFAGAWIETVWLLWLMKWT